MGQGTLSDSGGVMDGIFRWIRVRIDPKSVQDLEKNSRQALDKGTDPKTPKRNLTAVERAMDRVKKAAVSLGGALVAAFSVRAIARFAQSAIDASFALETSRNRLAVALRNEGIELQSVNAELEVFTRQLWETHRLTEGEVNPILQQLITITGDYDQSLRGVGVAADLAAATGMDATSAARLLGRVIRGDTNALRRYGIEIADGADALEVLEDRLQGMALAATPATEALSKAFGDLREEMGFAIREATDFDARVEGLTGVVTQLIGQKENFVRIIRELVRALRDVATAVAVLAGIKGLIVLRGAAIAAGGGVNFLIARLTALQAAMGPVGWLTLAISGVIVLFNRMRDAANDAARAADEAIARRDAAMVSGDRAEVRQALVEAQQALARSREIAREMQANRRRMTDSFRQQMREEEEAVRKLSERYNELLTSRDEALAPTPAPGVPTGEAAEVRRITGVDVGDLAGLGTDQAIAAYRQEVFRRFQVVELAAVDASMGALHELTERVRERQKRMAEDMRIRAEENAMALLNAFQPFFDGMAMGLLGIGGFAEEMLTGLRNFGAEVVQQMIQGKAEMNMADAVAKLASGTWPPNAAALKAAALHMSAAGMYRAIRSTGTGGSSTSSLRPPSATMPTSRVEAQPAEINVYIDPLNPSNPAWQSNLAQTLRGVSQRYGDAKVNVRPRTA